jgi:hypothetical protein
VLMSVENDIGAVVVQEPPRGPHWRIGMHG